MSFKHIKIKQIIKYAMNKYELKLFIGFYLSSTQSDKLFGFHAKKINLCFIVKLGNT